MTVSIPAIILIAGLQVVSCNSPENARSNSDKKENAEAGAPAGTSQPGWQVIASGNQSSIQDAREVIIRSQEDLDKLWDKAFTDTYNPVKKPAIDFSRNWLLAAFLGTVNSGGHSFTITDIRDGQFLFQHTKPGAGCIASMALEQPYVMAVVDQPVPAVTTFKTELVEKKCD